MNDVTDEEIDLSIPEPITALVQIKESNGSYIHASDLALNEWSDDEGHTFKVSDPKDPEIIGTGENIVYAVFDLLRQQHERRMLELDGELRFWLQ